MLQLTIGGNTKRSKFTAKTVELPDFKELPEASQAFIVGYGLKQYLADGAAGAESQADFEAGIDARLANVKSGEFKRAKGEGDSKPDTAETRAIKLAKAFIRDQLKAQNVTASKETVADGAKKLLEAKEGPLATIGKKLRDDAKKQVEAEAKAREEASQNGGAGLLAALGLAPVGSEEEDDEETND